MEDLERSGELRGRAVGRQSGAEGDGEIRDLGRNELTAESYGLVSASVRGQYPLGAIGKQSVKSVKSVTTFDTFDALRDVQPNLSPLRKPRLLLLILGFPTWHISCFPDPRV